MRPSGNGSRAGMAHPSTPQRTPRCSAQDAWHSQNGNLFFAESIESACTGEEDVWGGVMVKSERCALFLRT
jgi:hypothetical protein